MGNSIIGEWGICRIFTPRDGMGNSIIGEWGICKIFTPRDGMGNGESVEFLHHEMEWELHNRGMGNL